MADRDDMDPTAKALLAQRPPTYINGPGGLMERLGKLFYCMTGPPVAYFCYPGATVKPGEEFPTITHAYETLIYGMKGKWQDVIEVLVAAAWHDFRWAYELMASLDFPRPVLFWRLEPKVDEGYSGAEGENVVRLRMRVSIPGIEFPGAHTEGNYARLLTDEQVAALRAELQVGGAVAHAKAEDDKRAAGVASAAPTKQEVSDGKASSPGG